MRHTTLSLNSLDGLGEMMDDDSIYAMASQSSRTGGSYHRILEDGILFTEFLVFVEKHKAELISVIDPISTTETFVEARKLLGLTEKLFLRARNRLGVLYTCFTSSTQPPRQLKVYDTKQVVPTFLASLLAQMA
jgi:hypothetical protein